MGLFFPLTRIFALLFLIASVVFGIWGLIRWRKLMRVEYACMKERDTKRAAQLRNIRVKYAQHFKEACWCFFITLDMAIGMGYILIRFGALA